mmetsp:Transcript_4243/g.15250  ORF Transcript_4243/g.15250 Transcript_4243/m.15250 type:complete len:144 (+) Transcript_4243:82-513(+)
MEDEAAVAEAAPHVDAAEDDAAAAPSSSSSSAALPAAQPAPSSTDAAGVTAAAEEAGPKRVIVHLQAAGDAPLLKRSTFKVAATEKFAYVIGFLRRQLHVDGVCVYCNRAFAPSPDALMGDLLKAFGHSGMLALNYSLTPAWG